VGREVKSGERGIGESGNQGIGKSGIGESGNQGIGGVWKIGRLVGWGIGGMALHAQEGHVDAEEAESVTVFDWNVEVPVRQVGLGLVEAHEGCHLVA